MQSFYKFIATGISLFLPTFISPNQNAIASTVGNLEEIARSITVQIFENRNCSWEERDEACEDKEYVGSGVIVAKDDETYYVLTAKHVVNSPEGSYDIVAPNGMSYELTPVFRLDIDETKRLEIEGSSLGFASFSSSSQLSQATLATECVFHEWNTPDYVSSESSTRTFISPFCQPLSSLPEEAQQHRIRPQIIVSGYSKNGSSAAQFKSSIGTFEDRDSRSLIVQTPLAGSYELIYTNETEQGMSGGPILDATGRLIGIHGQAEGQDSRDGDIVFGYSLGIPIDVFLRQLSRLFSNEPNLTPSTLQILGESLTSATSSQQTSVALTETPDPCLLSDGVNLTMKELIERGNSFYRLGMYNDALGCLSIAIQNNQNPEPLALYAKGFILFRQANQEDLLELQKTQLLRRSIELFSAAIDADPNYYAAWRWKGVALHQLGNYEAAKEMLEQAIAVYPRQRGDYYQAYSNLASTLYELGLVEEAIAAEEVAGSDRRGYFGLIRRGNGLYGLGNYEEARRAFEEAAASRETAPEAWLGLSRILNKQGSYEEAIEKINQALNDAALELRLENFNLFSWGIASIQRSNSSDQNVSSSSESAQIELLFIGNPLSLPASLNPINDLPWAHVNHSGQYSEFNLTVHLTQPSSPWAGTSFDRSQILLALSRYFASAELPEDMSLSTVFFEMAEQAESMNLEARSLAFYNLALMTDRYNYLAWYRMGLNYLKQGAYLFAEDACGSAVSLQPNFQPAIDCLNRVRTINEEIVFLRESCQARRLRSGSFFLRWGIGLSDSGFPSSRLNSRTPSLQQQPEVLVDRPGQQVPSRSQSEEDWYSQGYSFLAGGRSHTPLGSSALCAPSGEPIDVNLSESLTDQLQTN